MKGFKAEVLRAEMLKKAKTKQVEDAHAAMEESNMAFFTRSRNPMTKLNDLKRSEDRTESIQNASRKRLERIRKIVKKAKKHI